jgi:glycosyltransferase involved in cell wall biosynthesis
MRIGFLSRRYFPAISGMSVYAQNLLRELVAAGHDVTMVSQYRADPAGAGVYGGGPPPAVPGVRVVGLESVGEKEVCDGRPADFEGDIARLVEAVEDDHARDPFDLLHAQYGYPTGLAALEAGRRLGLPVVVSIQGGDGHWVGTCCRTHRDAMRAVLLHADAVLIGSRSFAAEVVHNHGVPADIFTIVPGGTDTDRFRPADDARVGELSDPPTLLFHGRVDARKGLMELLDAFARLAAMRPLDLVVSGIGPDVQAAKDRVTALGVAERVRFTGYASYDEAPRAYRQGDIFVSPTYSEGFSNTILEAMASGLPIVSTRTVGVVDCLGHERDSLLVEPKDVDSLTAAIARLLDDAPLRTRLACRALADVRRLYSWPAVGRQIMAVYDEVADRVPSAGWLDLYDPRAVTVATADAGCRFRAAPHLL